MILAQMAALNYDGASAAASALRETLLPSVYFFCALGLVECAAHSRGHDHGQSLIMYFVGVAVIVVLTVNFPAAISYLQVSVKAMMNSHNEHVNNLFYQMLQANLSETPSWVDVGNYILYGIVKFLQGIGKVGIVIVDLLQNVSILALVGISPLLLGMLATSWTRSAGVRFMMTSLIICLWSVGTAIVDIVLYAVGQYIFGAAIGAGGAAGIGAVGAGSAAGLTLSTMAMPALVLAMAIAAFIPIALYLAVPIIMHSVMLGANPITAALGAGAGFAATGAGIAGANAARSIATAGGLASRAPAAASAIGSVGGVGGATMSPPVQGVTPSPNGLGGASAPVGGVVQQASGAFAAAIGAPHTSAQPGYQVQAPGGGAMSATQIDSSTFSVMSASGASQVFTGNVGNPQTLARAYNNMISTPNEKPISNPERSS